jgi:hypothetical protein
MGFRMVSAYRYSRVWWWHEYVAIKEIPSGVITSVQFILYEDFNNAIAIQTGGRILRMLMNLMSHFLQTLTEVIGNIQILCRLKMKQKLEMVLKIHQVFTFTCDILP